MLYATSVLASIPLWKIRSHEAPDVVRDFTKDISPKALSKEAEKLHKKSEVT